MLFVCWGNTCRSPLAEAIACSVAHAGFAFRSAGLEPHGSHAEPHAVAVATERGYGDLSGHVPTPLTDDLRAWADVAFVMEASQLEDVPGARMLSDGGVADPYGKDIGAYRTTADQLECAIQARLAELA